MKATLFSLLAFIPRHCVRYQRRNSCKCRTLFIFFACVSHSWTSQKSRALYRCDKDFRSYGINAHYSNDHIYIYIYMCKVSHKKKTSTMPGKLNGIGWQNMMQIFTSCENIVMFNKCFLKFIILCIHNKKVN